MEQKNIEEKILIKISEDLIKNFRTLLAEKEFNKHSNISNTAQLVDEIILYYKLNFLFTDIFKKDFNYMFSNFFSSSFYQKKIIVDLEEIKIEKELIEKYISYSSFLNKNRLINLETLHKIFKEATKDIIKEHPLFISNFNYNKKANILLSLKPSTKKNIEDIIKYFKEELSILYTKNCLLSDAISFFIKDINKKEIGVDFQNFIKLRVDCLSLSNLIKINKYL